MGLYKIGQWHKFLSLTNQKRLFLVNTFLLLGGVRLGLWLLSYQKLLHLLDKLSTVNSGYREIELNDIVRAVNISTHYMPGGAKCLARALTTQVLMKRQGYSPQLYIGVAKGEQGQLEAHAWIEYDQKIVIGELLNLSRYMPMSLYVKT